MPMKWAKMMHLLYEISSNSPADQEYICRYVQFISNRKTFFKQFLSAGVFDLRPAKVMRYFRICFGLCRYIYKYIYLVVLYVYKVELEINVV